LRSLSFRIGAKVVEGREFRATSPVYQPEYFIEGGFLGSVSTALRHPDFDR